MSLEGKVAIVSGASRGIGREVCIALAKKGCSIVVAAKSTSETPGIPGTIYSVVKELEAIPKRPQKHLAVKLDLLQDSDIDNLISCVLLEFGRIDILVNNASALWWHDIVDTPMKKYDLICNLNSRGTFAITKACLPHMAKNGFGRVINMSPPIRMDGFAGHTAYNISKFGMTMVALGVAAEFKEHGITGNTLWPATVIESYASINFKLGNPSTWRKATILADCVVHIVEEPNSFTANMLIDDTYLRSKGYSDSDLIQYRYNPAVEPPRLLDVDQVDSEQHRNWSRRGDIHSLDSDLSRSQSKL